ncbi:MAG: hypothetical protein IJO33_05380 [Bacilli bacterium]|nr:hypothetical protein [Bacilli bacterium]
MAKQKNEKKDFWYDYASFIIEKACYLDLVNDIKRIENELKEYDNLLKDNYNTPDQPLNFREQFELYSILNDSYRNPKNTDLKVVILKKRLLDVYPEVAKYLRLKSELNELRRRRDDTLSSIVFNEFIKDEDSRALCSDHHFLVYTGEELYCERCKATTKDYNLSLEDILFLSKCAAKQAELLSDKKEDIPLIRVLMEKLENEKKNREIPEQMPKLKADELREIYAVADAEEVKNMRKTILKAHSVDSRSYMLNLVYSRYISNGQKEYYLEIIDEQLREIENSDSQYKDLLLEQCKIARYEVMILAGAHIPTLLHNINPDDEIALTKAYYNINSKDFRINSTYFVGDNCTWDASIYYCLTANPKINQNILDLKLRR